MPGAVVVRVVRIDDAMLDGQARDAQPAGGAQPHRPRALPASEQGARLELDHDPLRPEHAVALALEPAPQVGHDRADGRSEVEPFDVDRQLGRAPDPGSRLGPDGRIVGRQLRPPADERHR